MKQRQNREKRVKIGIIGAGSIAQISHIPYILDDDSLFELTSISDLNSDLLNEVGDHYHISKRYTDYHELLESGDAEAVIICHSGSHHDSVMAALDRGKDLLVEKPLAWNVREAEEIAAKAKEKKSIVQLGYHKLYDPAFPVAKKLVDEMKELGYVNIAVYHPAAELYPAHLRIRKGKGAVKEGYAYPGSWEEQLDRLRNGLAGGELTALVDEILGERKESRELRQLAGTLNLSLIHNIYMMFGFLGKPKKIRHVETWRDTMSIHITAEYSPDLCCCMEWHHLPYLNDYREEYSFYGNSDRVSLRFPAPYYLHSPSPVLVQGGDGETAWEKKIIVSHDEAYRRELRDFHARILDREKPLANVESALEHLRFIQDVIDTAGID